MGARVFGAFAAGFAVGLLVLGAALWSTGSVKSSVLPPWLRNRMPAAATTALPEPPANLNANAQLPGPPVPPPEGAPAPPPASGASTVQGSAERAATESASIAPDTMLHLMMPISGVAPSSLTESFHDMRDGHEHEAVDIPAARNTPVKAVCDGSVAKLFTSKEGGLTVYEFDPTGKYVFYYAHLDHYPAGEKEGEPIHAGDVIGYVGTTGDAPPDTPHLHFAVFRLGPDHKWWKGTALDPVPMLK
jgi:murein DD-endopeptidase MepM/ murein hydrolase activator NlpD